MVNPQRDRQRKLEAACGYLELNMPEHALRELGRITDPEATPFDFYRLHGEGLRAIDRLKRRSTPTVRALAVDPEDIGVLAGMAWCYKRHGAAAQGDRGDGASLSGPSQGIDCALQPRLLFFAGRREVPALSWLGRALRMESSLRKQYPEGEGGFARWGFSQFEPSLRERIAEEPDFDPLRNDPDFQYLTGCRT